MSDTAGPDLAVLKALTDAGWGFYRNPATQRADDAMVRARASDSLARAAANVAAQERAARAAISAPTRENPLPDPAQLAAARALRALREQITALETRLRGSAAPPNRDGTALVLSAAQGAALIALDTALLALAEDVAADGVLARLDDLLTRRAALMAWR